MLGGQRDGERRRLVADEFERICRHAGRWKKNKEKVESRRKKQRREFCLTQTGVEKLRLLNFVLSPSNFNSFNYKPAGTCKQQSHD